MPHYETRTTAVACHLCVSLIQIFPDVPMKLDLMCLHCKHSETLNQICDRPSHVKESKLHVQRDNLEQT